MRLLLVLALIAAVNHCLVAEFVARRGRPAPSKLRGAAAVTQSLTPPSAEASGSVAELADALVLCDFWATVPVADREFRLRNWCDTRGVNGAYINGGPCSAAATAAWEGVSCVSGRVAHIELGAGSGGRLPTTIGGLDGLVMLALSGNSLTGPIPTEIGLLTALRILQLDSNSLTGRMPIQLGSLTNLFTMALDYNRLQGPIPEALCRLSNLDTLDLGINRLSSTIPRCMGRNMKGLRLLSLSNNALVGGIPSELGGLSSLTVLILFSNRLSGTLPSKLGGLTMLRQLWVEGNRLQGTVPEEIGGLRSLTWMNLADNAFNGTLPDTLGSLSRLSYLNFRQNRLTGPVPSALGGLSALTALYLDRNQLAGSLPTSLCKLNPTIDLNLQDNPALTCLPPCLASYKNLASSGLTTDCSGRGGTASEKEGLLKDEIAGVVLGALLIACGLLLVPFVVHSGGVKPAVMRLHEIVWGPLVPSAAAKRINWPELTSPLEISRGDSTAVFWAEYGQRVYVAVKIYKVSSKSEVAEIGRQVDDEEARLKRARFPGLTNDANESVVVCYGAAKGHPTPAWKRAVRKASANKYEFFCADDKCMMAVVTRYMKGGSLRDLIHPTDSAGTLVACDVGLAEKLRLLAMVARALESLHDSQMTYHSNKSELSNILALTADKVLLEEKSVSVVLTGILGSISEISRRKSIGPASWAEASRVAIDMDKAGLGRLMAEVLTDQQPVPSVSASSRDRGASTSASRWQRCPSWCSLLARAPVLSTPSASPAQPSEPSSSPRPSSLGLRYIVPLLPGNLEVAVKELIDSLNTKEGRAGLTLKSIHDTLDQARKRLLLHKFDVFLSYNWGRKEAGGVFRRQQLVEQVYTELQHRGYKPWLDKFDLNKDPDWWPKRNEGKPRDMVEGMKRGIENSTCVVMFFSPEYCTSENCKRELNIALELKKTIFVCMTGPDLDATTKTPKYPSWEKHWKFWKNEHGELLVPPDPPEVDKDPQQPTLTKTLNTLYCEFNEAYKVDWAAQPSEEDRKKLIWSESAMPRLISLLSATPKLSEPKRHEPSVPESADDHAITERDSEFVHASPPPTQQRYLCPCPLRGARQGLQSHVDVETDAIPNPIAERADQARKRLLLHKFDVFLSYNWGRKEAGGVFRRQQLVEQVYTELQHKGYKPWLDKFDLNKDPDWWPKRNEGKPRDMVEGMKRGIENSTCVVMFFSPEYCTSENCKRELKIALELKKPIFVCMTGPDLDATKTPLHPSWKESDWKLWKNEHGELLVPPDKDKDCEKLTLTKVLKTLYCEFNEAYQVDWAAQPSEEDRKKLIWSESAMPRLISLLSATPKLSEPKRHEPSVPESADDHAITERDSEFVHASPPPTQQRYLCPCPLRGARQGLQSHVDVEADAIPNPIAERAENARL